MSVPAQLGRTTSSRDEVIVLDASVAVDLLAGTELAAAAAARLRGTRLHVPAHFAAEVLSALGRLHRGGLLDDARAAAAVRRLAAMPVTEHDVPGLAVGAWGRRSRVRLVDAVYVELAERLDTVLVTTDRRLAREIDRAEVVSGS